MKSLINSRYTTVIPMPKEAKNPETECDVECAEKTTLEVLDIIKNKTKFQIYNLFEIYGKFTLTELTEKLGKSKSTVWGHLQTFMELGILKMSQIEKTVKGKVIKENEYQFTKNYEEVLSTNLNPSYDLSQIPSQEAAYQFLEGALAVSKRMSWFFEQAVEFYSKLLKSGPDEEARKILFEIIHTKRDEQGELEVTPKGGPKIESQSFYSWSYITQSDLKRYRKQMEGYKIKEKKEAEYPILYFASSMPIKKMIEYSLSH